MNQFVRRSLLCVAAAAGLAVAVGAGCGSGETDTDGFGLSEGELGAGSVKVTICHVPPGNPENAHTITVGEPALRAHLENHGGDFLGPCEAGDAGTDAGEDASVPVVIAPQ
jgi:hypothetical protein